MLTDIACSVGAMLVVLSPQVKAQAQVEQVTVPLIVEGNRPFVNVSFRRTDGSTRPARFLVDSGGGGFLLTEPLARDLGLEWGTPQREEGREFAVVTSAPPASIDDFPLELQANRILVALGSDNILPKAAPGRAEGLFPGHVLARHHVVFDYPAGRFTLARPGVLKPQGASAPMPVSAKSGFPVTQIEVAGRNYRLLLDTGASFTMVSETLLKSWGEEHPEWDRRQGAHGEAVTLGGQTLETMFVPAARWGTHPLTQLGVTSQREGTFERFMSQMTKEPILGALGGNVLKSFRVELDYKNEMLYLSVP